MATRNEKSPLTRNASGQRCANRETGAPTGTPSGIIDTAVENFSGQQGRADALTAKQALAAIETLEIVGDNNLSREPNAEDRSLLTEFIAHLFDGFHVEKPAEAPIGTRFTHPGCDVCERPWGACQADHAAPEPADERADAPLSLIPHLVARDERAVSTALLEMCDALTMWRGEAQKYREITSHDQTAFSDGYEAGIAAILSARATSANETGAEGAIVTDHDAKGLEIIAGWLDKDGLVEPATMLRRLAASRSPATAAAAPADERAAFEEAVRVFERAACHGSYRMRDGVAAVLKFAGARAAASPAATQADGRCEFATMSVDYVPGERGWMITNDGGIVINTPRDVTAAMVDVRAERRRQIEQEGWTPEHDDEQTSASVAVAAACLALLGAADVSDSADSWLQEWRRVALELWPYDVEWLKPAEPRRMHVKAAALILAEIERLDRAAARKGYGQ